MKIRTRSTRLRRFVRDVYTHTPLLKMVMLLIVLWLVFCYGIYLAEKDESGSMINSYPAALYWGWRLFLQRVLRIPH